MPNEARVLIIEDNDALRVMLFTVLRHQPLDVDTAATADEALAKVSQCDYALILMDANLPNDASLDFVRRFREQRPEATSFIIAVRDPNIDVAIDPGVVSAILNKPLEVDTLAEVVRECALVVPPPADPLPCPPSESDVRSQMDRGGSYWSN
jgi:DNA-binding response OmpR family regulator